MKNKYHIITYEKENIDTVKLVDMIKLDGWINPSTIIINCSPDYSSRLTQVVNHKLSYLNKNELYEQIPLEMPYPNMSQIYNPQTHKFELFDRYMIEWARTHIDKDYQYLFIDSGTLRGKNFNKVRMCVKPYLEPSQMRFASLYLEASSMFTPDYYVEEFDQEISGGLLFEWENADNPNWDY